MFYKIRIYSITMGLGLIMLCAVSCSVKKTTNIDYGSRIEAIDEAPQLDVFSNNKSSKELQPVLIFVYGGNWNSGEKETYTSVGRNFAKRDMVVVMPDYTKSPNASYKEMAQQIASSIFWVKENIRKYGGDPERIFITGHSAGGHLSALAVMNPEYGVPPDLIKGIILNDAAGLDMKTYLQNNPPTVDQNYITTWTQNSEEWEAASPIYFLNENTPKIKMYTGESTYKSIISSNKKFMERLQEFQPEASIQWLDKSHVSMVTQLFLPWNSRFDEIEAFMGID